VKSTLNLGLSGLQNAPDHHFMKSPYMYLFGTVRDRRPALDGERFPYGTAPVAEIAACMS